MPSLRESLTRKRQETRKGRAELKLAERPAALWNAKPENRHLPNVYEWLNIRFLTDVKAWSNPQQMMMRRSYGFTRHIGELFSRCCWRLAFWSLQQRSNYEDRIRAEEKFQHAKRLFDNSFLLISEDRLLKEPGFEALRKRLLGDFTSLYKALLDNDKADPGCAEALATEFKLARVDELTNDFQAAIAKYQATLEQQLTQLDQSPRIPPYGPTVVAPGMPSDERKICQVICRHRTRPICKPANIANRRSI